MRYLVTDLIAFAKRNPGTWEKITSTWTIDAGYIHAELPDVVIRGINLDVPQQTRITPPPLIKPWPWWARLLARASIAGEAGVGDTLHRLLPSASVEWCWRKLFKHDCGCCSRAMRLNRHYPYG